MTQQHSNQYIRRALQLARRGLGRVEPNPMVGAVLVRDDRVIGEGFHRGFGGPHAEVEALRDAQERGESTAGCDLYVTLEPCCHQGKTPACTEALLQAKVGRAFVSMVDPDARVSGRGIALLREAGVEVHIGLGEAGARRLNEPFIKRATTGLPWVIAKWAQTLDGRVATSTGSSKWISNDRSRMYVHKLRSRVDAVMVGIGTVLADDPRLTARHVKLKRIARRVVVDPDLKMPRDAQLLQGEGPPVTIAVREALLHDAPDRLQEMADQGVEFVGLPVDAAQPSRLLLQPLLEHLASRRNATNVLVEGGPRLIGSLMREQSIDEVLAFIAPKLLGDADARAAAEGLTCTLIEQATTLRLVEVKRLGDDVVLAYRA